eukprot:4578276-Alexandrium_andersonii.AAC.1
MERKNKVIKSCAEHSRRPGNTFEASVLSRVLVEQAGHLQQYMPQGLQAPRDDPEVAAALGVASCTTSDSLRCGRKTPTKGMVAYTSRQALLVHACAEAG